MLTSALPTVASSWLEVDLYSKCSISSSRCSIGLKSCDWAVYCSKLNLLSCSWSRSWTIPLMWHGVLPCWKNPSTAVLPCCYGCTWLAIALCYPVALNHRFSFIKGPNMCHGEKKTTHHCATAWCVAWLMHVLMWIFLRTLVFSSVWNSRNQDSSVFPIIWWSVFVP